MVPPTRPPAELRSGAKAPTGISACPGVAFHALAANAVQRHAGMEEFSSLEIVNPIGELEYYSAKPTVIDIRHGDQRRGAGPKSGRIR
ncbi:MAG: hypothetical protein WCG80_09725 [Spirochaetales bacterium]